MFSLRLSLYIYDTHGHCAVRAHIDCDTDLPLIIVISEDPWHLPNVWQWNCHYLFKRLRSLPTEDRTPDFSHARRTLLIYATAVVKRGFRILKKWCSLIKLTIANLFKSSVRFLLVWYTHVLTESSSYAFIILYIYKRIDTFWYFLRLFRLPHHQYITHGHT